MPQTVVFTVKDIVNIVKYRRENEFDSNIAVTGARGNGKSTLLGKIFFRIKTFNPWKHICYNREDAIRLLATQFKGQCWDDEAINSGYKRDFQSKAQQEMIKFLTAYRDNFNLFGSAIPNFFSLDKDLRDLYFIHLFVIERGIAHVHMPIQGRIYSTDKWDAAYNAKLEASWTIKMRNNPNFHPPYHKLTTFKGYLFFNDLGKLQKKVYKEVKKTKRKTSFEHFETPVEKETFEQKMFKAIIKGEVTKDFLVRSCEIHGEDYKKVQRKLSAMLRESGRGTLLQELGELKKRKEESMNKVRSFLDD